MDSNTSKIVLFTLGESTDHAGRTIADIWSMNNEALEPNRTTGALEPPAHSESLRPDPRRLLEPGPVSRDARSSRGLRGVRAIGSGPR